MDVIERLRKQGKDLGYEGETLLDFSKTEKGPGVWKMNVSTIHSAQFRESIMYLWPTWESKITEYEDILVWWEMVKYKIKQ